MIRGRIGRRFNRRAGPVAKPPSGPYLGGRDRWPSGLKAPAWRELTGAGSAILQASRAFRSGCREPHAKATRSTKSQGRHMRAIVYAEYGPPDVLQLTEVATPAPKDDEVLIRMRAASVNPLDWHYMRGTPFVLRLAAGLRKPKVTRLGADLAGQVDTVGKHVTQFQPGDEVFGVCKGAFAEYVCASESAVVLKPANVTFEQAAAVPVAAFSALQGLRDKGQIRRGSKVLINGAAGGVGTFAVQIAKTFGADVTGVCSTRNLDLVRSIGADHVIDYTHEDFTKGTQRYDLILDNVASHSLLEYKRVLNPNGIYVMIGSTTPGNWFGFLATPIKG